MQAKKHNETIEYKINHDSTSSIDSIAVHQ